MVNRNLKAKLKAFSKPQIFNSDLEYDDLRELREYVIAVSMPMQREVLQDD